MYDLKKCRPIQMDDLLRLGKNSDGGYIISKHQIERTECLLSFGVNEDWSFETDFLNKKNMRLYAFDNSVSTLVFKRRSLVSFAGMFVYLFTGNFSKAKSHKKLWLHYAQKARDFSDFFTSEKQRFFVQKFLGEKDNEIYAQPCSIFKDMLGTSISSLSVFVKMDIENWEYRTLPKFLPYFDKINGFVIEFHDLDIIGSKFMEIVELLSQHFYIAHIHANNWRGLIDNTDLPKFLEITFIHKYLLNDKIAPSTLRYPVEGLDFPCKKTEKDIPLNFS
jgi:hypothetical protein